MVPQSRLEQARSVLNHIAKEGPMLGMEVSLNNAQVFGGAWRVGRGRGEGLTHLCFAAKDNQ